ncbi:hypothetical protein C8R28_101273 [Nitrosomonas ureae]|uniref:DUF4145 domain-containing protein n=2 Tax=Nitrosomonas ureae TaxID=44577 RepID=A0A2T5IPY7_9PROT|nr:hypothetical protein C8R28_101273 [Nitrosomonas ureae]
MLGLPGIRIRMPIESKILDRINSLLGESDSLKRGNDHGQVRSEEHRQQCAEWITSAINLIQLLCENSGSSYRVRADHVVGNGINFCAHDQVGEIAAVLKALAKDAHAGVVASIANQARAEAFDEFLDHGEEYLRLGRKNEAGVIVGVVFEDSLRQVCRNLEVEDKGKQIDGLISELTSQGVLTAIKAKRARVAAHVRTKATHAQWDEFEVRDVEAAWSCPL